MMVVCSLQTTEGRRPAAVTAHSLLRLDVVHLGHIFRILYFSTQEGYHKDIFFIIYNFPLWSNQLTTLLPDRGAQGVSCRPHAGTKFVALRSCDA